MTNVTGSTADPNVAGVYGESTNASNQAGPGIHGVSRAAGVIGESTTWHGVYGSSKSTTGGAGLWGDGNPGPGVVGESTTWHGVYGSSKSTTGGAGLWGDGNPGPGVVGVSTTWIGVYGEAHGEVNGPAGVWGEHKGAGAGVKAVSKDGWGLGAFSTTSEAIHAETNSTTAAAVSALQMNPNSSTAALFAQHAGNGMAAVFRGDVEVSGDIRLPNADCAEEFNIAGGETVQPGTVMVLCDEGTLQPSERAYDKRVAGVISGAGAYRPGIVLDRQSTQANRQPIALLGKVFCKVDASYGAVEVGDLLTTSPTHGYAMKASDPTRVFGAVIGKALRPLQEGQALIPILIALQ